MPLPKEAGAMMAIDIFTASYSTDFAYAYSTHSEFVLSHGDLEPGLDLFFSGDGTEMFVPSTTSFIILSTCSSIIWWWMLVACLHYGLK